MRILVPFVISAEHADRRHFVRETYLRMFAAHGFLPLFVSSAMGDPQVDALYRMSDGLLLMGGLDIDPAAYGETPHEKTLLDAGQRTDLEIALVRRAMRDRKPVLGICKGAQVLAVACGGTLVQHLPEIVAEVHGVSEGLPGAPVPDQYHEVRLLPGTRMRELLGKERVLVNSAHHQSVRDPGDGLRVCGVSPQGVVEMIESVDPDHFCFGVQCHPERATDDAVAPLLAMFAAAMKRAPLSRNQGCARTAVPGIGDKGG